MTLEEARGSIGRWVVYRSPGRIPEHGVIRSVNEAFVFVRYAGDKHAKATQPEDLTLVTEAGVASHR